MVEKTQPRMIEHGAWTINTLAALAALVLPDTQFSYIVQGRTAIGDWGKPRIARWLSGDQSANVTNDPGRGIYVAPSSDLTGASGAFKFDHDGYTLPEYFGAVAETVSTVATDNVTALNNMVTAIGAGIAPRKVIFNGECYGLASQWLINGVPIQMEGKGDIGGAVDSLVLTQGTCLRRIGATTTGATVKFYNINFGGFSVKGFWFDANLTATKAFHMDACCGGSFENVLATGGTSMTGHLESTTATNSYHTFINTRWHKEADGGEALRLSGASGQANACHITFVNTTVIHASSGTGTSKGIVLGGCDNIRFFQTFAYCSIENGRSIYVDFSEYGPDFPVNITFFGLEAVGGIELGTGGATTTSPLQIFNWNLDNTFAARRTVLNNSSSTFSLIDDRMSIQGRVCFSANTSGSGQSVSAAAFTKLNYGVEDFDYVSVYSNATSRFTPPVGRYRISARAESGGTMTAGNTFLIMLYKNGSRLWDGTPGVCLIANYGVSEGTWVVDANGTDYFEIYIIHNASSGSITINNTTTGAFFMAEQV